MEKPKTLDKVKYALYRTADAARSPKAKWFVFGAVALTTTLLLGSKPDPKFPRATGD